MIFIETVIVPAPWVKILCKKGPFLLPCNNLVKNRQVSKQRIRRFQSLSNPKIKNEKSYIRRRGES